MAEDVTPDVVPALVAQHDRFLRFLEPRVGSREAAEEVLQAAFVKAIERGGELREGERATAWFYRLLRNAPIDHYRHRDAERRALARHAGEVSLTAEDDATLEHTVCQCVYALIPTLKPEYAGILKAVEVDEAPVAVVAAQLGVTPGNAAVRLHRARQALKSRLETACGTCTAHGCLDCSCEKAPR